MKRIYSDKRNGHSVEVIKVEEIDGGKRVYFYDPRKNGVQTLGRNRFVRSYIHIKGQRV